MDYGLLLPTSLSLLHTLSLGFTGDSFSQPHTCGGVTPLDGDPANLNGFFYLTTFKPLPLLCHDTIIRAPLPQGWGYVVESFVYRKFSCAICG